jgi:hypothetical protein
MVYTQKIRLTEGIINDMLTSVIFKLFIMKKNSTNVRKKSDILQFWRGLILEKKLIISTTQ